MFRRAVLFSFALSSVGFCASAKPAKASPPHQAITLACGCPYPDDLLTLERDLRTTRDPHFRKTLSEDLHCLRLKQIDFFYDSSVPKASPDVNSRIEPLEQLALDDFQRLTDWLFDQVAKNGAGAITDEQINAQNCRVALADAVELDNDHKVRLVDNLFTKERAKSKAASAASDARAQAVTDTDNCRKREEIAKLTETAKVQRCSDVLTPLVADARAHHDHNAFREDDRLLGELETVGSAIYKTKQKASAALDKQISDEKDPAKQAKLKEQQTALQAELSILETVAFFPAERRRCLHDPSIGVALQQDVKGITRCVQSLQDEIATIKAFHPGLEDVTRSDDEIAQLRRQLARIEDESRRIEEKLQNFEWKRAQEKRDTWNDRKRVLDQELRSDERDIEAVSYLEVLPVAASVCGRGRLNMRDRMEVAQCQGAIHMELEASDQARHRHEITFHAEEEQKKFLERQLDNVQARGSALATQRQKDLDKLNDELSKAKDDNAKAAKNLAIAAVQADLDSLLDSTIIPNAELNCVADRFSHLKINGSVTYVQRCIEALTRRVQIARGKEELGFDKSERAKVRYAELQLARFEEAGRRMASDLSAQKDDLDAQFAKATSGDDKNKIKAQQDATSKQLATLKGVVIVPGDDPQTEFADYEQWFNKISMGFQYSSLNEAFSKGFPRVGATIGFHYPRQTLPEESSNWSWRYGIYNIFSLNLTNTGESTPTSAAIVTHLGGTASHLTTFAAGTAAAADDPGTAAAPKITRALEFESAWFFPLWRNDYQVENPRLRTRIGPLLVLGARKADTDTFADDRAYFGFRSARSPDTYFDFMYGRTGTLHSHRVELRGQYQLPRSFTHGAKLTIGSVGNFGINKRRRGNSCAVDTGEPDCHNSEPDLISFYVTYDILGAELAKLFGGK